MIQHINEIADYSPNQEIRLLRNATTWRVNLQEICPNVRGDSCPDGFC